MDSLLGRGWFTKPPELCCEVLRTISPLPLSSAHSFSCIYLGDFSKPTVFFLQARSSQVFVLAGQGEGKHKCLGGLNIILDPQMKETSGCERVAEGC